MPISKERGSIGRYLTLEPGADDYVVCKKRSEILDATEGTNVPGSDICTAHLPLNRDRPVTQDDVDALRSLEDDIRKSSDPFLTEVGDRWRLKND